MQPWIRIPVCAALGLSFSGCDPRRLPEESEDGPDVAAPDPLVGQWRMVEAVVEEDGGFKSTAEYELTIEDDLTGALAVTIEYDAPGTEYDEVYDYSLTVTVMPLAANKYRLDFRDPTEPERPGTVSTCTIDGTTLTCDPDDEFLDTVVMERQD